LINLICPIIIIDRITTFTWIHHLDVKRITTPSEVRTKSSRAGNARQRQTKTRQNKTTQKTVIFLVRHVCKNREVVFAFCLYLCLCIVFFALSSVFSLFLLLPLTLLLPLSLTSVFCLLSLSLLYFLVSGFCLSSFSCFDFVFDYDYYLLSCLCL
jgi:hypothetical protein